MGRFFKFHWEVIQRERADEYRVDCPPGVELVWACGHRHRSCLAAMRCFVRHERRRPFAQVELCWRSGAPVFP